MEALLDQLHRMEAARRSGDGETAILVARTAAPALESYRPTNATSRAKAILVEVTGQVLQTELPPAP